MSERRSFIKKSATVAVGCCCLGVSQLFTSCTTTAYLTGKEDGNKVLVDISELVDQKYVVINNTKTPSPIYLKTISDNQYRAFSMHCTHKGCTVKPAGSIMVCPCHGAEFSGEGKVLGGPARENLKEYPVIVEGDSIVINISN